jgi:hypothetical protein
MWRPKQLLDPPVVRILYSHFQPELVQFLGWFSGRAQALNKNWIKNQNPTSLVKAANTMLNAESAGPQLKAFLAKKLASVQPVVVEEGERHEEVDNMLLEFRASIPDDGYYRDEEGNTSCGDDFPESNPEQGALDQE